MAVRLPPNAGGFIEFENHRLSPASAAATDQLHLQSPADEIPRRLLPSRFLLHPSAFLLPDSYFNHPIARS
jgi:hypothetical protein